MSSNLSLSLDMYVFLKLLPMIFTILQNGSDGLEYQRQLHIGYGKINIIIPYFNKFDEFGKISVIVSCHETRSFHWHYEIR